MQTFTILFLVIFSSIFSDAYVMQCEEAQEDGCTIYITTSETNLLEKVVKLLPFGPESLGLQNNQFPTDEKKLEEINDQLPDYIDQTSMKTFTAELGEKYKLPTYVEIVLDTMKTPGSSNINGEYQFKRI